MNENQNQPTTQTTGLLQNLGLGGYAGGIPIKIEPKTFAIAGAITVAVVALCALAVAVIKKKIK